NGGSGGGYGGGNGFSRRNRGGDTGSGDTGSAGGSTGGSTTVTSLDLFSLPTWTERLKKLDAAKAQLPADQDDRTRKDIAGKPAAKASTPQPVKAARLTTPTPAPAAPVKPASQTAAPAPPPAPEDPVKNIALMGVVHQGETPEAWLVDVTSNDRQTAGRGQSA